MYAPFGLEERVRSACGRCYIQLTRRFHLLSRDGERWWLETEDRGPATEDELRELAERLHEFTACSTILEQKDKWKGGG